MVSTTRRWIWGAVVVCSMVAVGLFSAGRHDLADRLISQPQPPPAGWPQATPVIESVAKPVATATLPEALRPTAPTVVLSGVALSAGGGNVAIVSIDQRPEMLVRVGDALSPLATVVRIDDGSMTYRFAGAELRVLVKLQQHVSAPIKPDAPPKPLPGFIAGAPAMARAAGSEPGSGNDAFRQAIEKKMQAIAAGR